MNRILLFLLFSQLFIAGITAQKTVAITIDDIPNTSKFQKDNYQSLFLQQLDSLNIPIAIFINEGLIYKTDAVVKNYSLLHDWINKDWITLGNHTFNHPWYSSIGIDSFKVEVERGEAISQELARVYEKPLKHFRFPFNDLGKDSLQHIQAREFLNSKGYSLTPFTVESSDWMFNYLYEYYLSINDEKQARRIGERYVEQTMTNFKYIDSLTEKQYGRDIRHIYLCHDNSINIGYLPKIIDLLNRRRYTMISLDQALEDPIYQQEDHFYKKWGISWIYRWIEDPQKRMQLMRQEPELDDIQKEYNELVERNKGKK